MSFSTTGTHDATRLNQAAAHDTGIYDPDVHDNQIVAMYETDAQARSAQDTLIASGVAASTIQLVARGTTGGETLGGVNAEDANGGIWGAISSLFAPESDRTAYTHAIGRGHAMLVVTPTAGMDRQKVVSTLELTDPVDFDARLEEWRQAGYDTSSVHEDYAGYAASGSPSGTTSAYASATPESFATPAPATTGYKAAAAAAPSGQDTIEVMEERLRVGKRVVAGGGVRIRSYVVERPVQEEVRLHEEHVTVERHAVDRPATSAEFGAFTERTIEARATSEEAVIGKETRVVEEIGLKKQATERVETVHDTVRKTEVDIQQESAPGIGKGAGVAQPVSTPGAGSSGTNSPRR